MKKIKRSTALILFGILVIGMFLYSIWAWNTKMFTDEVKSNHTEFVVIDHVTTPVLQYPTNITSSDLNYCTSHYIVNWFNVILIIFLIVIFIIEIIHYVESDKESMLKWCSYSNDRYKDDTSITFNFKKYILIFIGILILYNSISFIRSSYKNIKIIYNTSVKYHHNFNKKEQEKAGFYDKMWKSYMQKDKIANINRETFILIAKIIMENRADGKNVSWKWVQENQQIPFNEFTKFYSDLSDYITEQRDGYYKIELECQDIANNNNVLLDTFPNNIYNRFLNCKKIDFEYGILSDSTLNVIKSKKENLK